jgi:hypothetical protein
LTESAVARVAELQRRLALPSPTKIGSRSVFDRTDLERVGAVPLARKADPFTLAPATPCRGAVPNGRAVLLFRYVDRDF